MLPPLLAAARCRFAFAASAAYAMRFAASVTLCHADAAATPLYYVLLLRYDTPRLRCRLIGFSLRLPPLLIHFTLMPSPRCRADYCLSMPPLFAIYAERTISRYAARAAAYMTMRALFAPQQRGARRCAGGDAAVVYAASAAISDDAHDARVLFARRRDASRATP